MKSVKVNSNRYHEILALILEQPIGTQFTEDELLRALRFKYGTYQSVQPELDEIFHREGVLTASTVRVSNVSRAMKKKYLVISQTRNVDLSKTRKDELTQKAKSLSEKINFGSFPFVRNRELAEIVTLDDLDPEFYNLNLSQSRRVNLYLEYLFKKNEVVTFTARSLFKDLSELSDGFDFQTVYSAITNNKNRGYIERMSNGIFKLVRDPLEKLTNTGNSIFDKLVEVLQLADFEDAFTTRDIVNAHHEVYPNDKGSTIASAISILMKGGFLVVVSGIGTKESPYKYKYGKSLVGMTYQKIKQDPDLVDYFTKVKNDAKRNYAKKRSLLYLAEIEPSKPESEIEPKLESKVEVKAEEKRELDDAFDAVSLALENLHSLLIKERESTKFDLSKVSWEDLTAEVQRRMTKK